MNIPKWSKYLKLNYYRNLKNLTTPNFKISYTAKYRLNKLKYIPCKFVMYDIPLIITF